MASPEVHDWEKAKRIARYLKGKARAIQHFAFGKTAPQLDGFTDLDWAGERPSMKSTSGCILMWSGCLIKSWSGTRTTIALNSAEAELYAMSRCAQHALFLVSFASDLNIELHPTIHTDASAALSIAYRSGADLWVHSTVSKVGTSENPADMLTNFLSAESLGRHSKNVRYEFPVDNFQVLKARDNLAACSEFEVRFKNLAKHLGIARAQERWIPSQPLLNDAQRGSPVL